MHKARLRADPPGVRLTRTLTNPVAAQVLHLQQRAAPQQNGCSSTGRGHRRHHKEAHTRAVTSPTRAVLQALGAALSSKRQHNQQRQHRQRHIGRTRLRITQRTHTQSTGRPTSQTLRGHRVVRSLRQWSAYQPNRKLRQSAMPRTIQTCSTRTARTQM